MKAFLDDPIVYADNLQGRRVIKCHMPMEMLPPNLLDKCKVIYVARNIKDMAISWFHHIKDISPHDFQVKPESFKSIALVQKIKTGKYGRQS